MNASDRVRRSMELYQKAVRLIPGATQLISRRPSRFAFGVSPIYADRARGAHFWDVDGNEYIDWVSDIGAIILGYCDPVVDDAVREQIGRGVTFSINNELEIELAEELVRTVPCAEMVRYAKGGGEACAIAVRIARGATGRDRILFCGYHGWHDWYLAANLSNDATLDEHLFPGIEPLGVPKALAGTAIPFPYGDLAALGELLDRYKGEVAAVMMEPMRSDLPPEGYLEGVRRLATDHDVILVFDEVSCGFRSAPGGVEEFTGITPDMAVFAKSLSNGYPMGAVVGCREVMEPAANMFISSTYWSDCIGLTAALVTLRELRRREAVPRMHEIGCRLKQGISAVMAETGVPGNCSGVDVHPSVRFEIEDASILRKVNTLYVQEMCRRGCFGYPSFYLNAAQSDADLDATLEAARETFRVIREALDENRLDERIECELTLDSFRRLVR